MIMIMWPPMRERGKVERRQEIRKEGRPTGPPPSILPSDGQGSCTEHSVRKFFYKTNTHGTANIGEL